jgi:hypothetical protein
LVSSGTHVKLGGDHVADCSDVLVPSIEIRQRSQLTHLAYLNTITETNFEEKKREIAGSGELSLLDFASGLWGSGSAAARYGSFDQKRQSLFSQQGLVWDELQKDAIYRKSVPDAAYSAFVQCMRSKALGLEVWFDSDSDDSAIATVRFGSPGSTKYVTTLEGATAVNHDDLAGTLPGAGTHSILMRRVSPENDIKIVVNGEGGFSASALSIAPFKFRPKMPHIIDVSSLASFAATPNPGTPPNPECLRAASPWNSDAYAHLGAPSVELTLNFNKLVALTQFDIYVSQDPPGNTIHNLKALMFDNTWQTIKTFAARTVQGEHLQAVWNPPVVGVQALVIQTVESPSVVGWRSINVSGYSADQLR